MTPFQYNMADHSTAVSVTTQTTGIPVVLVHALGLDHRMWTGVVSNIAEKRPTLSYDLRCNGAALTAPVADLSQYSDDLRFLIEDQCGGRAHIVGLSMGGAIAMTLAAQALDCCESLTLVCAPAFSVPAFEERALAAERDGVQSQLGVTLERWFSNESLENHHPGVEYASDCVRAMEIREWAANWRALAQFRPSAIPSTLKCTIIAGDSDQSTPPSHMKTLLDYAPHATFSTIPGGAHLLVLEQPEELSALLVLATA